MKKLLISFLLIISASLSFAQLKVNSVTIRTVELTFDINETEPKEVKNTFDEIPIRITGEIMGIDDEIYKVVLIVKKRYTNVYRIFYREENNDELSDYPETITFVEYFSADKTLKKITHEGNEIVSMNYILE
ncbi:hypothetical protein ACFLU5_15160 [Bacteroidota bacterium]